MVRYACPNCNHELIIGDVTELPDGYSVELGCYNCGGGNTIFIPKTETERRTTVVNLKDQPYDVYIGRGSKWGNPFKMHNSSAAERNRVCNMYEEWFWKTNLINDIHELRGKVLGCYCKPLRCHGDFLAKVANGEIKNEEIK